MLVLKRKANERINFILPDGTRIVLLVDQIRSRSVRLGVDAPANVRVVRAELPERIVERE